MMDAGVWKSHPSTLLCVDLWEVCQCRGVEEPCRKEREFSSLESPSSVFYFAEGEKKGKGEEGKIQQSIFLNPLPFFIIRLCFIHMLLVLKA